MRETGKDDLVDIAQHVREGLATLGRATGQAFADRSGLYLRKHGIALDLLHVTGDSLDDRMTAAPELVRRHVPGIVHG